MEITLDSDLQGLGEEAAKKKLNKLSKRHLLAILQEDAIFKTYSKKKLIDHIYDHISIFP